MQLKFIDSRVLNTPPIAIGQARRETQRMAEVALETLEETILFLDDGKGKRLQALERREELIDLLQREISDFLVKLSQRSISEQTSVTIGSLLHTVNDLERIGDYCENLWKLRLKQDAEGIRFSEIGRSELAEISEKTYEFLAVIVDAMASRDHSISSTAIDYEDSIDALERDLKNNHIARLNTGECAVPPGLIFIDMLHNFEKIGDHTFNISEALLGEK